MKKFGQRDAIEIKHKIEETVWTETRRQQKRILFQKELQGIEENLQTKVHLESLKMTFRKTACRKTPGHNGIRLKGFTFGGVHGIIVTVIGNRHGDQSSKFAFNIAVWE